MILASAQSLLDAAAALAQSDAPPHTRNERQRDYARLFDEYSEAKAAFTEAREAYESTPEGIAGLKDDLAARRFELGGGGIDADPHYQDLLFRLHIGQSQRARQLAAYKQAHRTTAPPPESDVEDEDEAAAPPPLCTCIDYRYEGVCGHVEEHVETVPRSRLSPTGSNTGATGPRETTPPSTPAEPTVHYMEMPDEPRRGSPLVTGLLLDGAPERPDPGPARRRSLVARFFSR